MDKYSLLSFHLFLFCFDNANNIFYVSPLNRTSYSFRSQRVIYYSSCQSKIHFELQRRYRNSLCMYIYCIYHWCIVSLTNKMWMTESQFSLRNVREKIKLFQARIFDDGNDVVRRCSGTISGCRACISANLKMHTLSRTSRGHALCTMSKRSPSQILFPLQSG